MKRDLSKLTDEQVLELAKKEGNPITKQSLAIFSNPEKFFVDTKDVDYEEAYRLLRKAMEDSKLTFSVGLVADGDDLDYDKMYVIDVY